jgi:hypothetical protein
MTDVELPDLERPAFFDGQRLTAADLAAAQAYARELRWLHNRSLHDWGIAFGYTVTGVRGERTIAVGPGYALDCAGRDLILEEARELEVPAVAGAAGGGPAAFHLTVSYAPDETLDREERDGVCGARGAVRLVDEPSLRWQDPLTTDPEGALRPGLDVIVATVSVEACRLALVPSLAHRRDIRRTGPFVAGGRTQAGATGWRLWPDEATAVGVATDVDTAAAGFGSAPRYQARLGGERVLGSQAVVDGHAHIAATSATGFEFRVILPPSRDGGRSETGEGLPLNSTELIGPGLPELVRDQLSWHVVWIGVEE